MVWDYARSIHLAVRRVTGVVRSEWVARYHRSWRSNGKSCLPTSYEALPRNLPYPDGYFDAVITDPPYYNNIAYADLSDFFYVWLKRTRR